MSEINQENIDSLTKKLTEVSKEIGKNMRSNYRQRLVYNLLNALRNREKNKFFDILLRVTNKDENSDRELANLLSEVNVLPPESFEKCGYAIVIGIMASEENNTQR